MCLLSLSLHELTTQTHNPQSFVSPNDPNAQMPKAALARCPDELVLEIAA